MSFEDKKTAFMNEHHLTSMNSENEREFSALCRKEISEIKFVNPCEHPELFGTDKKCFFLPRAQECQRFDDEFLRWYAVHNNLREKPIFINYYKTLECSLSGDVDMLYATDSSFKCQMDHYWRYIITFMFMAFSPSEQRQFFPNEQPIIPTEWNIIISKSINRNGGKSGMKDLFPVNAWTKFFRSNLKECNGPYYLGVKRNNVGSMLTRIHGKWNCGIEEGTKKIRSRNKRAHVHHLIYKCFKVGHGYLHQPISLMHNPLLNKCKCPDSRVCLNPECYDLVCSGFKRKRVEGLSRDDKIEVFQIFQKNNPWAKNEMIMSEILPVLYPNICS